MHMKMLVAAPALISCPLSRVLWLAIDCSDVGSTIAHKIFETSSSFHKIADNGKSLISVFQEFTATINKTFILAGRLGTRLSFYEVWTVF